MSGIISEWTQKVREQLCGEDGHIRQPMSYEEIMATREEARQKLIEFVADLHYAAGLSDHKIGRSKEEHSIQRKAKLSYNGDRTRIMDYERAKGVVTTPEEVRAVQALLSDRDGRRSDFMRQHGSYVVKENDFFEEPKDTTGYRCINYKIGLPVGNDGKLHVVELQIVAEQIEKVYKESREHKRLAEEILNTDSDLTREQRRAVAAHFAVCRLTNGLAARDNGYDSLLRPEARGKHALTRTRELKLGNQAGFLETYDPE